MKYVEFTAVARDVTSAYTKVSTDAYLGSGELPIIDQAEGDIAGYLSSKPDKLPEAREVIVFGDHTKRFKFVSGKFVLGADGAKVLCPLSEVHPRYLLHALRAIELPNLGYSRHFKFLKESKVPLPELEEQRRIAAILDKADEIRAKRQQVLDHLDTLTQSIFHDMFGAARKWTTLGEICSAYSGGTPDKGIAEFWTGDLPWFSPKDLKSDDLLESIDHITEEAQVTKGLKQLLPGTIIVGVRGMILVHTFPVCVLRVHGTINQDVKALLPKWEIEPDFLAAAIRFQSYWVLSRVSTSAHGTKKIDTAVLNAIPIPEIALPDQKEFAQRIGQLRTLRTSFLNAQRTDQLLATSLADKAFRGEL